MAVQSLSDMERRLVAGREYLVALRQLGFDPDAVLWAEVGSERDHPEMELLIVTTWADNIGPKAVYDLLFEAYDASATPCEVNPFVVSLVSPNTQVATDLNKAFHAIRSDRLPHGSTPITILGMLEYFTIPAWVIFHRVANSTRFEDARRFSAFRNNISRLAA